MGQGVLPGHQEWGSHQEGLYHRKPGGGGMQIRQSGLSSIQGQCPQHQWMVQGLDGVIYEIRYERERADTTPGGSDPAD